MRHVARRHRHRDRDYSSQPSNGGHNRSRYNNRRKILMDAFEAAGGDPAAVVEELSLALGEAWDEELEPFRHAAEGAPVRWLHRVG